MKLVFDSEKLKNIIEEIDKYLSERDSIRESAIKKARDVIKFSGWAITAVHKGNLNEAKNYLQRTEDAAKELLNLVKNYPEIYYSGMVYNAVSEYVEARIFIDIISGSDIKGHKELGVQPVPYLQGLGDVVGELRRLALEFIRKDNYDMAWKLLKVMESIYFELRKFDYPEAIVPGIRHKADVARRLIDDTKALIVDLEKRHKLSREIETLLNNFSK